MTKLKTSAPQIPLPTNIQEFEAIDSTPLENGEVKPPFTLPELKNPDRVDFDNAQARKLQAIAEAAGIDLGFKLPEVLDAISALRDNEEKIRKKIAEYNAGRYGVDPAKFSSTVVRVSWHDRLARDVQLGRTVAIRGAAGNGKSLGAKTVLKALGYTVYSMDCTDSTTAESLVGGLFPVPKEGGIAMEFRDGLFAKAFKDPKGAILLDEFDALDPRTGMTIQSALHRARANEKRSLSCPDNPEGNILAQGLCPIVVTLNTWGNGATREYVGRNAIDAANFDRFDSIISTDYECEVEILTSTTQIDFNQAKAIVETAKEARAQIARQNLRVILSTRRLLTIAESVQKLGYGIPKAFELDFLERLEPEEAKLLTLHYFV